MMDCTALTKKAILEGEKIRKSVGVKMVSPLSVFDAAQKLNVDVWFKNIPSLEGIYSGGDHPGIVLGSDRPLGRQSFNCAHELGHHVFGHGYGVDEIDSRYSERNKKDPDEFLVDAFAANFLMPQFAILKAFKAREIKIQTAEPVEIYQVANYFEVGYSTLINHLAYGCNIIDYKKAEELLKVKPQEIRQSLLGKSSNSELIIVNEHWTDRAVDIRIDDQILTPHGVECEGKGIQEVEEGTNGVVFKGVLQSPTSRLINAKTGWCQFVRIMPRQYEGLAEYRHMEESEDGN